MLQLARARTESVWCYLDASHVNTGSDSCGVWVSEVPLSICFMTLIITATGPIFSKAAVENTGNQSPRYSAWKRKKRGKPV